MDESQQHGSIDLANASLTAAMEPWRQTWQPQAPAQHVRLLMRPLTDPRGLAQPPEKRKAGAHNLMIRRGPAEKIED